LIFTDIWGERAALLRNIAKHLPDQTSHPRRDASLYSPKYFPGEIEEINEIPVLGPKIELKTSRIRSSSSDFYRDSIPCLYALLPDMTQEFHLYHKPWREIEINNCRLCYKIATGWTAEEFGLLSQERGRRLGGPQSRSGSCWVGKNLLFLPGIEAHRYSYWAIPALSSILCLLCPCAICKNLKTKHWLRVRRRGSSSPYGVTLKIITWYENLFPKYLLCQYDAIFQICEENYMHIYFVSFSRTYSWRSRCSASNFQVT
jgi:hypothetical protein